MDTEKATDAKEAKEQEKRMEGRVVGIIEKGVNKYKLELLRPGKELPNYVWVNTKAEKPKVKDGGELKIDDYIVFAYTESKYMSHGQETTSRWIKGDIEIVDNAIMQGRSEPAGQAGKIGDYPTMEDTADFKPASEIKPLETIVAERVGVMMAYRNELKKAMQRDLTEEECGWLSTLFIDHMKEHRINRKFGVQDVY